MQCLRMDSKDVVRMDIAVATQVPSATWRPGGTCTDAPQIIKILVSGCNIHPISDNNDCSECADEKGKETECIN